MKRLRLLILVIVSVLVVSFTAFAADEINVTVNTNFLEFDVAPAIIDGRTMVPVRVIFEALGAEVEWDHDTKTVTATRDALTINLTINDKAIYVNGDKHELDVPALIIDGRTLVPARAVSEAFGADVQWDSKNRAVYINEYSPSYRELIRLMENEGEYYPDTKWYEVYYKPDGGEEDLGFLDIIYEPNSAYPFQFLYSIADYELYIFPDGTGETLEYELDYLEENYLTGKIRCSSIVGWDETVLDYNEEQSYKNDLLSNLACAEAIIMCQTMQTWIDNDTDSDLKLESLGFTSYLSETEVLFTSDTCPICGDMSDVLTEAEKEFLVLLEIEEAGEPYCQAHYSEYLSKNMDKDDVVLLIGYGLRASVPADVGETSCELDGTTLVASLIFDEEIYAYLEEQAIAEGYSSVKEALISEGTEEAAIEDSSIELSEMFNELSGYGLEIEVEKIVINYCSPDGEILFSLEIPISDDIAA